MRPCMLCTRVYATQVHASSATQRSAPQQGRAGRFDGRFDGSMEDSMEDSMAGTLRPWHGTSHGMACRRRAVPFMSGKFEPLDGKKFADWLHQPLAPPFHDSPSPSPPRCACGHAHRHPDGPCAAHRWKAHAEPGHFEYRQRLYPRDRHAVGDADAENEALDGKKFAGWLHQPSAPPFHDSPLAIATYSKTGVPYIFGRWW